MIIQTSTIIANTGNKFQDSIGTLCEGGFCLHSFFFQELLGLVYEEIEKPHVWNEDIQMVRALLELHFALCFFSAYH